MSNRNIVNLSSAEHSFLDNLIRSGSSKARVLIRRMAEINGLPSFLPTGSSDLGYIESISRVAVYQRLKNSLKPWQVRSWCIGKPLAKFVAKMEDILDVYQRPYDPAWPVACTDEKSKQLLSTPRGSIEPGPGEPEREATNMSVTALAISEPLIGRRWVNVTERRISIDFADQLKNLVDAERVVLVSDNLNTHVVASLYESQHKMHQSRSRGYIQLYIKTRLREH